MDIGKRCVGNKFKEGSGFLNHHLYSLNNLLKWQNLTRTKQHRILHLINQNGSVRRKKSMKAGNSSRSPDKVGSVNDGGSQQAVPQVHKENTQNPGSSNEVAVGTIPPC